MEQYKHTIAVADCAERYCGSDFLSPQYSLPCEAESIYGELIGTKMVVGSARDGARSDSHWLSVNQ
jgi:hypothetical protein